MTKVTKTNKTTSVAVSTAKSASEVIQLLEAKLATYEKVSMTPFKTGGKVTLPVAGTSVKLEECSDTELLIRAAGNIRFNESIYNDGAALLGLTNYKAFNHSGYSAEDWIHDLQLRYKIVQQHDVETQLRAQIEKMRQFISKEEQFQMSLNEVAGVLKNLG